MNKKIRSRYIVSESWEIFQEQWWKLILFLTTVILLSLVADSFVPTSQKDYVVPQAAAVLYEQGRMYQRELAEYDMMHRIQLMLKDYRAETAVTQTVTIPGTGHWWGSLVYAVIMALVGIMSVSVMLRFARRKTVTMRSVVEHISFKKGIYLVITAMLHGLSVAVGLVLFIVPGLIFLFMFMYAIYFVVDKDMNPIQAMKESKRVTTGHKWCMVKTMVWSHIILFVGLIFLGVGLFVAIPITALLYPVLYVVLIDKNSTHTHDHKISEKSNEDQDAIIVNKIEEGDTTQATV